MLHFERDCWKNLGIRQQLRIQSATDRLRGFERGVVCVFQREKILYPYSIAERILLVHNWALRPSCMSKGEGQVGRKIL
jgi:hypothetical protein